MSHIFLSYASVDRERAGQVADLLSELGWEVWWDRTIPPGRQFDDVIEEALDAAACVVVLWSKASIASTWVKTEAAEANRRKVLIPVLIEEVKIPLEFRRVQAADLAAWQGDKAHPEVDKLIAAIANEIGRPGSPRSSERGSGGASQEPSPPSVQPSVGPSPVLPSPTPAALSPQRSVEQHSAPAGASAGLKWGVAGAVLVLLLGGFFWYQSSEQSRQREFQAERQRQDLERKLEEERRNAETDRARREKEAADQAARERAARDQLAQERAARDAAERETARRRAADEAAAQARARQAEEANARRPAEATQARGPTSASPSTFTAPLTWRDHVLTYSGVLTWDNTSATLRAVINDINTGQMIGRYTVPARVSMRSQNEYFIQAEFAIPGDSTTPGPHTHQVGLIVRPQSDGSLRLVQNCPQPGRCF